MRNTFRTHPVCVYAFPATGKTTLIDKTRGFVTSEDSDFVRFEHSQFFRNCVRLKRDEPRLFVTNLHRQPVLDTPVRWLYVLPNWDVLVSHFLTSRPDLLSKASLRVWHGWYNDSVDFVHSLMMRGDSRVILREPVDDDYSLVDLVMEVCRE